MERYFRRKRAATIIVDVCGCCHISKIDQKVKLLLRHNQQGFEPATSIDQDRITSPLIGIELTTIDRVVMALAN